MSYIDDPIFIDDEHCIYKEVSKKIEGFYYTTVEKTEHQFKVSNEELLTLEEVEYDIEGYEPEIRALGRLKKELNEGNFRSVRTLKEAKEILFSTINNIQPNKIREIKWERANHNSMVSLVMVTGLFLTPFIVVFVKEIFFWLLFTGLVITIIRKDEISVCTFLTQLVMLGMVLWVGFEKSMTQESLKCFNFIYLYLLQNLLLNRKMD